MQYALGLSFLSLRELRLSRGALAAAQKRRENPMRACWRATEYYFLENC